MNRRSLLKGTAMLAGVALTSHVGTANTVSVDTWKFWQVPCDFFLPGEWQNGNVDGKLLIRVMRGMDLGPHTREIVEDERYRFYGRPKCFSWRVEDKSI